MTWLCYCRHHPADAELAQWQQRCSSTDFFYDIDISFIIHRTVNDNIIVYTISPQLITLNGLNNCCNGSSQSWGVSYLCEVWLVHVPITWLTISRLVVCYQHCQMSLVIGKCHHGVVATVPLYNVTSRLTLASSLSALSTTHYLYRCTQLWSATIMPQVYTVIATHNCTFYIWFYQPF